MYSNKFVISILVNGQVCKEFANNETHLPFGCEFSIRLRNKNERRAVAKLFIDGEKMCRGGFVVPAHSYVDIECSSQTNRKFKFVDLQSTEAQDHGKDQDNKEKKMGLVEVQWHLEKEKPVVGEIHHHHHYPSPKSWPTFKCCAAPPSFGSARDCDYSQDSLEILPAPSLKECGAAPRRREIRDGATVDGNYSKQRFGRCDVDMEEHATILKLYLRGFYPDVNELSDSTEVRYCDRCGTKIAKKTSNFCHICGKKLI